MIIGFDTRIMPEMAARTLCRSVRLRTQFCGVLQKAQMSSTQSCGAMATMPAARAGEVSTRFAPFWASPPAAEIRAMLPPLLCPSS
jgi:hypothetical protein